jgi:hypothetical protein
VFDHGHAQTPIEYEGSKKAKARLTCKNVWL